MRRHRWLRSSQAVLLAAFVFLHGCSQKKEEAAKPPPEVVVVTVQPRRLALTTKNAILIVQFAKARVDEGMGLIEATLEGAKLRLRPIVMTSLAFGFGVLPLAIANGAGAGAQKAIGTGVLGGVVTSTLLVTIFAPLFYVLIEKIFGKRAKS